MTSTEVHHFDMDDDDNLTETLFSSTVNARGISFGDDFIYVSDHGTGNVFKLAAGGRSNADIEAWVKVEGVYGVHCVNDENSAVMAMFAGLLLILLT